MDKLNKTGSAAIELEEAIGRLGAHDHLCLIDETREEQFAAVVPYIKMGIERNEKCIYIVDDNTADVVISAMKAEGIDVVVKVETGQLTILGKQGILDPGINFVSKPISPSELLKKVREVLGVGQ